ncbi:Type cbb3 cytochrome oxidase biogenesis protein CcoS, involved in heme b insertion [Rhodopirellula islandica]|uniref:Type cbb3 cytochrome oxidase biogenesis protein CcoS, involved in heme b insertion n=1 Tax=Rhodopirellula islandica TaxID=595434 RepID=A0A0J1BH11_RHOIS|nr:cbb3-type cytochrome oxidase assembly protein CcoS [Rhodopirellula islandica]KLU05816.1 Type cbb3 cytochrome oxidase biogenesis protein CcoS, involved in heme b insertion [Rhodopirellula islandica]
MSVLFIALPLALLLGAGGMLACIMCIRGGQYDDLESPAVRILIDEDGQPRDRKTDAPGANETTDSPQTSQGRLP